MANPQMDWQIHKTNLSARFKELYLNNQWSDCAFNVGNGNTKVLKGHKIVLAASSPVFEALFYGAMAETKDVIDVPDLEPETFRLLLNYIYCDQTEMKTIDTTGQLLYAAKKYMMPHLARVCLDYLLEHTFISTLWEVLAVAEDLHEDELLAACLKVMCQYPGEMWLNNNERIGLVTLSLLLDQACTNLLEVELWQLASVWAEDQCSSQGLAPTPANQRALLNQTGILSKIRLLTLSPTEMNEVVEPSGLLTAEELRALRSCASHSPSPTCDTTFPTSLNPCRDLRKRFMSVSSRCVRKCLSKRKNYTYCGTVKCRVSTDSRILVTGFEVFTRIASTADYIMGHGLVNHYSEDMVMTLYDSEGNLINKTEVSGVVAFFNVTQEISLSEPVWFLPNQEYTVAFELSKGQYPLSDLSTIAFSKSVCFRFKQSEQLLTNIDTTSIDLDVSFINAVIFNL